MIAVKARVTGTGGLPTAAGRQLTTFSQPGPTAEHLVPAGQQEPSGVPQFTAFGRGQQPQPVAEKEDLAQLEPAAQVVLWTVSQTRAPAIAGSASSSERTRWWTRRTAITPS